VPALELTRLAESPDSVNLTTVTGLVVAADGRVYVSDFPSLRVIVLSAAGVPERTIGGRGAGPGEFEFIQGLQLLPDDSLLIYDQGQNRVTVYPPELDTVAYVVNLAAASAHAPPLQLRRLAGESGFVAAYSPPFTASGSERDDRGRTELLRLLDAEGRVRRDSLQVAPAEEMLVSRVDGTVMVAANPLARRNVFDVAPDGRIYYGRTDSASLMVYSPSGERVEVIPLPQRLEPVTSADLDRVAADVGPAFGRALRKNAPRIWPAFHRLMTDEQGSIWLETGGIDRRLVQVKRDGSTAGVAPLPQDFEPRAVRGGRVYGVSRGQDGVPRVLILGIRGVP
jgi:sugar lactone lactonase YvrE